MATYANASGVHYLDAPVEGDAMPLTASDLAAFVHDLLEARGQKPVLTPETRDAAKHAAALLLATFGVAATV